MKVTLSVIALTVVLVGTALGILSWYILSSGQEKPVEGGQKGISVLNCYGTHLQLQNVGTVLINGTTYDIYEKYSNQKTGAQVTVQGLGPTAIDTFSVVNSSNPGQPVDLSRWSSDSFYLYNPGLPTVFFPCPQKV
jgi:hypothetical protein